MQGPLTKAEALYLAPKPLVTGDTTLTIVVEAGVVSEFRRPAHLVACLYTGPLLGGDDELLACVLVLVADGMV